MFRLNSQGWGLVSFGLLLMTFHTKDKKAAPVSVYPLLFYPLTLWLPAAFFFNTSCRYCYYWGPCNLCSKLQQISKQMWHRTLKYDELCISITQCLHIKPLPRGRALRQSAYTVHKLPQDSSHIPTIWANPYDIHCAIFPILSLVICWHSLHMSQCM